MRISDWSSDVCSSDLAIGPPPLACAMGHEGQVLRVVSHGLSSSGRDGGGVVDADLDHAFRIDQAGALAHHVVDEVRRPVAVPGDVADRKSTRLNSSH